MIAQPLAVKNLELKLLGVGEVRLARRVLKFAARKTLALFVYLALEGQATRSFLADLFWSEVTEDAARRNLRRELFRLREMGLADFIAGDSEQLRFLGSQDNDVQQFRILLSQGQLEEALGLWHGDLLYGLKLERALGFETWLEQQRSVLQGLRYQALLERAEHLETKGAWREALGAYLQLLELDPFQERLHRQVMRLHDLLGQREAALQQFKQCQTMLQSEFALEPLPETLLLYERIRDAKKPESLQALPLIALEPLSSPFVGREQIIQALLGHQKGMIVLLGQAGLGKSRVLDELPISAQRIVFYQSSSQIPLHSIAELLRMAWYNPEQQPHLLQLEPIWKREVARLLPEIVPEIVPPPQPEERSRFLEGLSQALVAISAQGLMLDDLQWADQSSLELIVYVLQRSTIRIWAASRPDWSSQTKHILEGLEREGLLGWVQLEPLSQLEIQEWLRLLGAGNAPHLAKDFWDTSAGHPFFILETLRFLLAQGQLSIQNGQWQTKYQNTPPLPPTVQTAILDRLVPLGMASKRVLEAATISNAPFALEEIQGATALSDWENLEGLERAVQAQILWQQDNRYQFTHDLTRLALESAISQERKQFIHRKLAAALEQRPTAPARIAWHLEQAGQGVQAVKWRIQAARAAEQVFAYREAQAQYRLALENRADVPSTFEAQVRLVRLNELLNQPQIWQQDLVQLEQDSATLPEEAQVSLAFERIHFLIWHSKDQEAFEASQELVKHNLSTLQRAQVLEYQAYALANFGRLDESDALRSEVIAMLTEPHQIRGQAMYGCMMSAYKRSDHSQALEWCKRCEAEFRILGLRHYLINTNIMLGILAVIQGEPARAVEALESALEEAQNLSDSYRSLAAIFNLCEVYFELGNLGAVHHKLEQVKIVQPHFVDPFTEGAYVRNQSLLAWYTGQLGQAIILAKQAFELDERSQALEHRLLGRLTLAGYYLELGASTYAEPLLQEFKALRQDSNLGFFDMMFALQSTDLLLQQGQPQDALVQLEQAQTLLSNARTDEQAQYQIALARVYKQLGNQAKALAALESMPKQYSLWNQQRLENLRYQLLPKKTKPKPKITQTNLLLLEYQHLHQHPETKRSLALLLSSLEGFSDLQACLQAKVQN